jgi:choline dehydrogenase-like flavoprotein
MEFDYVIIGAGSAGSVLAGRLSQDPSVRVALLESGPTDASTAIHCPAGLALLPRLPSLTQFVNTVPQPGLNGRCAAIPRGRVLGGSSSTNAMIYARGHPADYDAWAHMGCTGWAWHDVLPWFMHAENNAAYDQLDPTLHGRHGPMHVSHLLEPNVFSQRFVQAGVQAGYTHNPDFNGATQEGVGLYQVTQHKGERMSAAKAYLTPHLGRSNLKVFTGVQVDKVSLLNWRVSAVHGWQQGQTLKLSARREVLLCAGALESPAVLMRSGIGPGEHLQAVGIPVQHHLPGVGNNLHDHPDVVLVAETPKGQDLFGISPVGAWNVLRGLWDWRQHRQGVLTTNIAEAGGFIRTQAGLPQPDVQLHFVVAKLQDHGRQVSWGHGFSVHVCVLQPRSRGTVRLCSASAHDVPLVDPQFLSDAYDVSTMVEGVKAARRIMAQTSLARYGREWATSSGYQTDAEIEQWVRNHTDTIYHPVGTCRMGMGPDAVVDSQCRVHGVTGLRVVDASVMPRIVSGNTNAPTIMLAERVAAWLQPHQNPLT